MRFALLAVVAFAAVLAVHCVPSNAELVSGFRPPAIPLFAFSPALQAWIRGDKLTDTTPTHWFIGQNSTMTGYISVDGTAYRWLGLDVVSSPFLGYLRGQAMTDRPGQDITGSPVKLPDGATALDCAVLCTLNAACLSWSFLPYNASSGPCEQSYAQCNLRSGAGTAQPDQCRSSGDPPLHWNSTFTDGVPGTDRPGNDLLDFDADADFTARDCAEACWQSEGCGGFVFAHKGCDRSSGTHCWVKGTPLPDPVPYSDCRQSGMGPALTGWTSPGWSFPTTPAMPQLSVAVQPTQTVVRFQSAAVTAVVTFTQPAFPHDPFASSREHVYITVEVSSNDGQPHKVKVYLDAASDLVVSMPSSPQDAVVWEDVTQQLQPANAMAHGYSMKVHDAKPFAFTGDSTRPNWGTVRAPDTHRPLDADPTLCLTAHQC